MNFGAHGQAPNFFHVPSSPSKRTKTHTSDRNGDGTFSVLNRSRSALRLPSFQQMGISSVPFSPLSTWEHRSAGRHAGHDTHRSSTPLSAESRNTVHLRSRSESASRTTPLLTPPEELDAIEWRETSASLPTQSECSISSQTTGSGPTVSSQTSNSSTTLAAAPLGSGIMDGTGNQPESNLWSTRIPQIILSSFQNSHDVEQVEFVTQTLPVQAIDEGSRATLEEVVEVVQLRIPDAPFITITHAVPQVHAIKELPKSPPVTPNASHGDHYFASEQTIFTRAAAVPTYHPTEPRPATTEDVAPSQIAPPFSINVSILERYIPPTVPREIEDFFSPSSSKSYLQDRLHELSGKSGSLILMYPTKKGGEDFVRSYLGPVIEPFLRQFILLNNLTANIAMALNRMEAIDAMLSFDEMKNKVDHLCSTLSNRPHFRGKKSTFHIAHCETTEVTLDRPTWMHWFIEQEQHRIRQNVVDYHAAGERMPHARGNSKSEVTVAMLTREVIEGLRRSDAKAGATGIEVGVFVIRRDAKQT